MPIDYSLGKIYKLYIEGFDKFYIGSTAEPRLCNRLKGHKRSYKHWKACKTNYIAAFELFELVNNNPDKYGKVEICLIEPAPCNNCDELRMKEQEQINKYKHLIVNKHNAYTSDEDKKEYHKEYMKDYYEHNKEQKKEYDKEYYEHNKEHKKQYKKAYYEDNKVKLKEKQQCECGGKYTTAGKSKHIKSKKHIKYISNNLGSI